MHGAEPALVRENCRGFAKRRQGRQCRQSPGDEGFVRMWWPSEPCQWQSPSRHPGWIPDSGLAKRCDCPHPVVFYSPRRYRYTARLGSQNLGGRLTSGLRKTPKENTTQRNRKQMPARRPGFFPDFPWPWFCDICYLGGLAS